jgi:DNA (cytosine-5)-methyltransferase 1
MKEIGPLTLGSVCDGIGCGHLAFVMEGCDCLWSSEIEAFPGEVLAYRFPDTPNLGDMRNVAGMVARGEIAAPDVFTGGTPCQAFSVAGLRKGLDDERGNLSLEFCRIADAIDDVRRRDGKPVCAVLWENVPGVLSDKGNAFGCFLGALSGAGCQLQPPGGKWRNAGCVFGPSRTVAWRTLDSQFFGVAQRRRRVFVVAGSGAFRPEQVLFEREGVRRDTPPSREKGQGVTHDLAPCLGASGRGFERTGDTRGQDAVVAVADTCGALCADTHPGCYSGQDAYTGRLAVSVQDVRDVDKRQNGKGWNDDGTAYTLDAAATQGVCIGFHHNAQACQLPSDRRDTSVCDALTCSQGAAVAQGVAYGFTTKESGKDAAADFIPPLRAESGDPHMGGRMAVAFGGDIARTLSARHDSSPCADRGMDVVATGMQVRRLLPSECEALQGLPRKWTLIPWRGKPAADCPDGPRYKGIGNGQTVTVMRWLAARIAKEIERNKEETE